MSNENKEEKNVQGLVYGVDRRIPEELKDNYNFRRTIVKGLSGVASFKFTYIIKDRKNTYTGKVYGNAGFVSLDRKIDMTRTYLRARDDAKYKAFRETKLFFETGSRKNFNIYEQVLSNVNIELLLEDYNIRYNTAGINIKTQNYKYKTKKGIKKYRFNVIRDVSTGRIVSRSRFRNQKFDEDVFDEAF